MYIAYSKPRSEPGISPLSLGSMFSDRDVLVYLLIDSHPSGNVITMFWLYLALHG